MPFQSSSHHIVSYVSFLFVPGVNHSPPHQTHCWGGWPQQHREVFLLNREVFLLNSSDRKEHRALAVSLSTLSAAGALLGSSETNGGKTHHSSAWHCFSLSIMHQKSQLALVGGSDLAPIRHPSVLQHKARRMHGVGAQQCNAPWNPTSKQTWSTWCQSSCSALQLSYAHQCSEQGISVCVYVHAGKFWKDFRTAVACLKIKQ